MPEQPIEVVDVERLRQVDVCAVGQSARDVLPQGAGRQHHDGYTGCVGIGLELGADLRPLEQRHCPVEHNRRRLAFTDRFECLLPVPDRDDLVASPGEPRADQP